MTYFDKFYTEGPLNKNEILAAKIHRFSNTVLKIIAEDMTSWISQESIPKHLTN